MIFLSASIPLEDRHPKYFNTADKTAIRDAVRALATVVIPKAHLVWGGHPSITPLIRHVLETLGSSSANRVTLYQSDFFPKQPKDNDYIEKIVRTEKLSDRDSSLLHMRERMFTDQKFIAGIFIGGMEGVEDEYQLFKKYNPKAMALPIASTGAAAKIVFEKNFDHTNERNNRLLTDYAYMALFKSLLKGKIKL